MILSFLHVADVVNVRPKYNHHVFALHTQFPLPRVGVFLDFVKHFGLVDFPVKLLFVVLEVEQKDGHRGFLEAEGLEKLCLDVAYVILGRA